MAARALPTTVARHRRHTGDCAHESEVIAVRKNEEWEEVSRTCRKFSGSVPQLLTTKQLRGVVEAIPEYKRPGGDDEEDDEPKVADSSSQTYPFVLTRFILPRGSRASMTRAVLSATEPPCAFTIASALRYEDVLLVGTKDEQACLTASVKGLAKPRPGGGGADGGGGGGKTRRASAAALRKSPYASAAGNATPLRARADVAANAAATATADGGATARVTRVNGEGLKGMGILDAAESLWEWIQYRVRLMPTRLVLDFVRDGW